LVFSLQTIFVMPSSSARCSQLPRAVDKVPFYVALRKLRDFKRGDLPHLDESEVTFPDLELKVEPRKDRLDRQLKQQQEAAAAVAVNRAGFDKKRRFDGDSEFDSVFPGMRAGYPPFQSMGCRTAVMAGILHLRHDGLECRLHHLSAFSTHQPLLVRH
jgi:hypothetical protein